MTRFWIGVVSKEHVLRGVEGGFCQLCHGKKAPLNRMKKGDYLLYYSPKYQMNDQEKLQNFTVKQLWNMAGRRFLEKCSVKTKKHLSDKESVKKISL